MKKIAYGLATMIMVTSATLLTGCAIGKSDSATLYDLGPLSVQPAATLPALPPISIAEARVPAWLDSPMMYFRLSYANNQQPRPYAYARWTMPPAQLLTQHLKTRIAQAGGIPLTPADGTPGVPVLRIEVDDFIQYFDTPERSLGQVALRASVFRERALLAQRSFIRQAPAPNADAAGGASALATASDAAIADLIVWLHTLPLK